MAGQVAEAHVEIAAPVGAVWAALTEPARISTWMPGTTVTTTWEVGSTITWSGEYDGKPFEDTGEVLVVDAPTHLAMTHASGGGPAHTVTYRLQDLGDRTRIDLTQDGCADADQAAMFSQSWDSMLTAVADAV